MEYGTLQFEKIKRSFDFWIYESWNNSAIVITMTRESLYFYHVQNVLNAEARHINVPLAARVFYQHLIHN